MNNFGGGVPDLGRQLQVVIRERRILSPASCELRTGGLTIAGCDVHVEFIDLISGVMYLVPLNDSQADALRDAIDDYQVQQRPEVGE